MRIALYTLGCKLNQYETEAIASIIKEKGYTLIPVKNKADIYVINTCTVTTKSEQKARRIIRTCVKKNGNAPVIITGCYAQLDPDRCADIHENVIVVPQDKKDRLLYFFKTIGLYDFSLLTLQEQKSVITNIIQEKPEKPYDPFAFVPVSFQFHSRAFLKIQDGCNCGCIYCRIPLARGPSVSLDPGEILKRISCIQKTGYKEIVLTGVNISSYNYSGLRIHHLIQKILDTTDGFRLRLSSLEPDMIDKGLLEILSHPRICPHFHIPIQSGSDRILKAMKRRYNAEKITYTCRMLRNAQPGCFLGADILTGFPGERDDDHQLSVKLIKKCSISRLHVFPYSPRPGTPAYTIKQGIPGSVKKTRLSGLLTLSENLYQEYIQHWKGRKVEVVLEKKSISGDNGYAVFEGLSGNYLRINVRAIPYEQAYCGNIVKCCIEEPGIPGTARYIK